RRPLRLELRRTPIGHRGFDRPQQLLELGEALGEGPAREAGRRNGLREDGPRALERTEERAEHLEGLLELRREAPATEHRRYSRSARTPSAIAGSFDAIASTLHRRSIRTVSGSSTVQVPTSTPASWAARTKGSPSGTSERVPG